MSTGNKWSDRGQAAVGAAGDLAVGIGAGLMGLVNRVKNRDQIPTMKAVAVLSGKIIAQNGEIKPEELAAFTDFLNENQTEAIFQSVSVDDMVAIMRDAAGREMSKAVNPADAFFAEALAPIKAGSDGARMLLYCCTRIAYADGDCDPAEGAVLMDLAQKLNLDLNTTISIVFEDMTAKANALANPVGAAALPTMPQMPQLPGTAPAAPALAAPAPQPAAIPAPPPPQAAPQPAPVAPQPQAAPPQPVTLQEPCGACSGSGKFGAMACPSCKGTGHKA